MSPLPKVEQPVTLGPFASCDELLETGLQMILMRAACTKTTVESTPEKTSAAKVPAGQDTDAKVNEPTPETSKEADAALKDQEATARWHQRLALTEKSNAFCRRLRPVGLSCLEVEIVLTLILDGLRMLPSKISSCVELAQMVSRSPSEYLAAVRALADDGSLCRAGILMFVDPGKPLLLRDPCLEGTVIRQVLGNAPATRPLAGLRSEKEWFEELQRVYFFFLARYEAIEAKKSLFGNSDDELEIRLRIDAACEKLDHALKLHSSWRATRIINEAGPLSETERRVLYILMGREVGNLPDDKLANGLALALAVTRDSAQALESVQQLFASDAPLMRKHLVKRKSVQQISKPTLFDLMWATYQLTPVAFRDLRIKRPRRVPALDQTEESMKPRLKFANLVLHESVMKSLQMVIAQARNTKRLLKNWGIGKTIPYGRGLILLFSGEPGTGKTACAEALAGELKRPFHVMTYPAILSKWFGETEQNLNQAFLKAKQQNAVLFLDEADGLLSDRSQADRQHEVRHVNTFLKEIESYDGICILATNLKPTLDGALERRIAIKVEFPLPDRAMRRQIWGLLLPSQMPLADDVDLDALSQYELTGGEIKNIVLNAARLALMRNREGPLMALDFMAALAMERAHSWTKETNTAAGRIGFDRT